MMVSALKFVFLFVCSVVIASPAHAYLDPGTGSMLLQGIIGGIAASVTVVSLYWQKIKAHFNKSDSDE